MSWNLIIYKQGNSLGRPDHVKAVFSSVFSELEWQSPTEAALPVEGGFRLELTEQDGLVVDVSTHGGFNHLRQFAELCKREGWRMADAQEGEDVDLDDPVRWMEERCG
jgi:hypothetical protein